MKKPGVATGLMEGACEERCGTAGAVPPVAAAAAITRSLRTALFWDVGNVFDTNCGSKPDCEKVGFSGMASSVGLGVTWITALGPLSFSLAMPVKKPDDADTQVFQFSLGQTF